MMESTVTYIVIAIIMALTITVYNYKKKKIRYYLLSKQQYPELTISVDIKKTEGKISAIIISNTAKVPVEIVDFKVELISKKREFNYYSLQQLLIDNSLPAVLNNAQKFQFEISFDKFKELLMEGELLFRTFRFVTISKNGRSFKSHEMGFNSRWVIYRPDSGNYN